MEVLPSALLQKIFFLADLNCSLPLSTPMAAHALSSEQIYRTLTLLAFWDESESWTGDTTPWLEQSFVEVTGVQEPVDLRRYRGDAARRALQRAIMKTRWFTLARVKQLQADIMRALILRITWLGEPVRMASLQRLRLEHMLEADGSTPADSHQQQQQQQQQQHDPPQQCQPRSDAVTVYAREPAGDWLHIHVSAGPRFSLEMHDHFCGQRLAFPGRLLAVPDNRLRGTPWTARKVAFLHDLRGLFPVSDSLALDMSTRAVHQGIVTAMTKGDLDALDVVLKYNVAAYARDRQQFAVRKQYHVCPQYFKIAQRQDNAKSIKRVLKRHLAEQRGSATAGSVPAADEASELVLAGEKTEHGRCQAWTRGVVRRTFSRNLKEHRPREAAGTRG
ncbi:hypothetical protein KEM52_003227 [Ascosphaera acerosa]|nr:hypothetical protein KEM52_003227 [Ascosphaera acerosa]